MWHTKTHPEREGAIKQPQQPEGPHQSSGSVKRPIKDSSSRPPQSVNHSPLTLHLQGLNHYK